MLLFKPIKPKKLFDSTIITDALEKECEAIANDILLDYELTTSTWEHQVAFQKLTQVGPDGITILVDTDDKIWKYVDLGTKPHMIRPKGNWSLRFKSGYKAKTTPGIIPAHKGGSSGKDVYRKWVKHPGTKARNFDKVITKLWKPKFTKRLETVLKNSVKRTGYSIQA